MVHIRRLNVRNFKMFSGDATLNFQPGFNIITGPNGSGKSNIIDAIQFVLGELSTKRMRVADLSGLIFDPGSEQTQNQSQYAHVTLYLDNADRGLPQDRNTVSVGRRIDRQGKSVYFVNRKRSSRRQVVDILEMAGIASGGYNIVLQGTATRLSDLTPNERMNALESLVGITEYDEKKATAKARLNEAERKIEVASARIEEIKKQVNELEKQRNNAIRFNLIEKEERKLMALGLSFQLDQLNEKLESINSQIKEREAEITSIEEERQSYREERLNAQNRLDEYNREASEKGNTRLPLLNSELVGKRTLKDSLESRIREINQRKTQLFTSIEEKNREIEDSNSGIESRKQALQELETFEKDLREELDTKQTDLIEQEDKVVKARETAELNQIKLENLTESLVPMQESLSGIDTEINRHTISSDNLKSKIDELLGRRESFVERREALEDKLKEYDAFKESESKKLEDLIQTLESQVDRQKSIRSTIENANQLAKDAETTITEFTAKRDLWDRFVTEEKALERIMEIGEAGAMDGYHGPLRGLIKIDLPLQRAADSSSNGWINAVVVDDFETAKESVLRLQKTKIGMTRFIPLNQLRKSENMPEFKDKLVIGAIPELIRYDEMYTSAVHLLWGDTYIVEDENAAEIVTSKGYRAVTKSGSVFEPEGGIIGGYYRRPPDYSKLIPTQDSIKNLSGTIRTLRSRLGSRMKELRSTGIDLRKFASFMDDSQDRIKRIDDDKNSTQDSIIRLDRTLATLDENVENAKNELDNEKRLNIILNDRKVLITQRIQDVKDEIALLKEFKLSDVTDLEIQKNYLTHAITELNNKMNELENDRTIQTSFVERILVLKIKEAEEVKIQAQNDVETLENEENEINQEIKVISVDVEELQTILNDVTSEVEATTKILEQHQRTLRQITNRIEQSERRRSEAERRRDRLILESERIIFQSEQRLEELARIGYPDQLDVSGEDFEQVNQRLTRIRSEKRGLGGINQLAIQNYHIQMQEYKQRSTRINGMEEEKQSILKFIEEVEREKTEHFMVAYNQICENFSTIFTKLTGGGDGLLELQKPEDPFTGGVDLYIQFPGKPMRLASGASGGERSVAAIAYLLAIQRFLKAPFYLFDEIDAHLDDVNTNRLSEVLRENAADSQFLMVSLKDVMVHNADRVYGVFAQNGRSRVLALPMREARVAA